VALRLRELVRQAGCTGTRVYDADVVAKALVHGLDSIATANVADSEILGLQMELLDLAALDIEGGTS
jgi:hypothetical protein